MGVLFKFTMAGAAFAALALGYGVWAQPVVQNTFSGNECWNTGQGPGGPSTGFVCSQAVRGGANNVALTISGSFTVGAAGTTGVSVTTAPLAYGGRLLVTAQPAAATITLPPNPLQDGIVVSYCNVSNGNFAAAAVAFAANTGQTAAAPVTTALTTQALGTCAAVQWNLAAATWYRIN